MQQPDQAASPAPRRWRRPAAAMLFLLTVAAAMLAPVGPTGRAFGAALDLTHAPAAAVVTYVLLFGLRDWLPRSRTAAALLVAAAVSIGGGLIELGQALTGRFPSWHDALANVAGAVAAAVWCTRSEDSRPRRWCAAIAAVALVIGAAWPGLSTLLDVWRQRQDFPLIASFETRKELTRWGTLDCLATRSREHVTLGEWSLRAELLPAQYPGFGLEEPIRDWSHYAYLEFDLYLEQGPPLDLIVKVHDLHQNHEDWDRFQKVLHLAPGPHHVRIPLADVAAAPRDRRMDMTNITFLQFFAVRQTQPHVLFVDNVRLTGAAN